MAPRNRFRTKSKAYGHITPDEERLIQEHCDKWVAVAYRTEPIEPSKIVPAIEAIYQAAGMNKPEVVIAPSPLAAAYIYGAAAAYHVRRDYEKVSDPVGAYIAGKNQASDKLRLAIADPAVKAAHAATKTLMRNDWPEGEELPLKLRWHDRYSIGEQIRAHLENNMIGAWRPVVDGLPASLVFELIKRAKKAAKDAIENWNDATYALYHAILKATIGEAALPSVQFRLPRNDSVVAAHLAAAVKAGPDYDAPDSLERQYSDAALSFEGDSLAWECAKHWHHACHGGNMWSAQEAFVSGMREIFGIDYPEVFEPFKHWETAAREGSIRFLHDKFCVVSDFPQFIKRDPEGRAHCADGPSHKYRDGWSLYHWHGVPIPGRWVEEPGSLTAEEAVTWTNIEQRRAACEILGWSAILDKLQAKTIDADGDPEIGTLVEVSLPGIPELGQASVVARFVRVRCGTGREFALCVPPDIPTAIAAQAWLVGLELQDFVKPEIRA